MFSLATLGKRSMGRGLTPGSSRILEVGGNPGWEVGVSEDRRVSGGRLGLQLMLAKV